MTLGQVCFQPKLPQGCLIKADKIEMEEQFCKPLCALFKEKSKIGNASGPVDGRGLDTYSSSWQYKG